MMENYPSTPYVIGGNRKPCYSYFLTANNLGLCARLSGGGLCHTPTTSTAILQQRILVQPYCAGGTDPLHGSPARQRNPTLISGVQVAELPCFPYTVRGSLQKNDANSVLLSAFPKPSNEFVLYCIEGCLGSISDVEFI
jgi:hypothetical protein